MIEKIKLRVDIVDLYEGMSIQGDLRTQFEFEVLNEAQTTKCHICYLHSLLNLRALSTSDQLGDKIGYEKAFYYKFLFAYKLLDSLRIYHNWVGLEDEFNETKLIMMVAYLFGILISAAVTIYMFDRFLKKNVKKAKKYEEEEIVEEVKSVIEETMDQRVQDKLIRE